MQKSLFDEEENKEEVTPEKKRKFKRLLKKAILNDVDKSKKQWLTDKINEDGEYAAMYVQAQLKVFIHGSLNTFCPSYTFCEKCYKELDDNSKEFYYNVKPYCKKCYEEVKQ